MSLVKKLTEHFYTSYSCSSILFSKTDDFYYVTNFNAVIDELVTTYDRSQLIKRSISTLREKLIEESIVVALVCLIFLWHIRSALVAIITLPVTVVCAILIRLTSPGPVFFKQERCGLNRRPFTMYKLRSMVDNAEQARYELEILNEPRRDGRDGLELQADAGPREGQDGERGPVRRHGDVRFCRLRA